MNSIEINDKEAEEKLRRKNPGCNNPECKVGDFQKWKGIVICLQCSIEGDEKYGKSAVMPKDFVILS